METLRMVFGSGTYLPQACAASQVFFFESLGFRGSAGSG